MKTPLPPDPEEMNESRAAYAGVAIDRFADISGIRDEDTFSKVQDLLCNLMHLCDRTAGVDFDDALVCARIHYGDETCDDSDPESGTYMAEEDEPSPFDDDEGEVSPFAAQYWATADADNELSSVQRYNLTGMSDGAEKPEPEPLTPADWVANDAHTGPTPMDEVLAALDALMTATVDNCLSDGIELTEAEADAREKALVVFSKYGKGGK